MSIARRSCGCCLPLSARYPKAAAARPTARPSRSSPTARWGHGQQPEGPVRRRRARTSRYGSTSRRGVTFVKVSSGGCACYAIDRSGKLWARGANQKNGQLGTNSGALIETNPVRFPALPGCGQPRRRVPVGPVICRSIVRASCRTRGGKGTYPFAAAQAWPSWVSQSSMRTSACPVALAGWRA